jgi:hypothetical protein
LQTLDDLTNARTDAHFLHRGQHLTAALTGEAVSPGIFWQVLPATSEMTLVS